ncbi:MAG: hypothetical protein EBZ49_09445 [Proteobacteria bacterium]|nr:hypothetical protein [Pseudomonadota bacterium]
MHGFGCNLLLFDISPNGNLASELNASYVTLEEIYQGAHAISLHVPLTPQTQYLINQKALTQMRHGVFLINTGRGALVNTKDLINQLKTGHIGGAALDVYEEEESIFFLDHSNEVLQDDTFARLLTFPNVIITSHQGFLTQEALGNIALTTLTNIQDFERQNPLKHQVTAPAN